MICEACGVEAPTKQVEFHQNIGAFLGRVHFSVEGEFCKSCVHKLFWKLNMINLLLGWWSLVSMFVTPLFILYNLVRYLCCLGMPPVPHGAAPPTLTDEASKAIRPHSEQILARLDRFEHLNKIATDIAYTSGTTPGQVVLYARGLLQIAKQKAQS